MLSRTRLNSDQGNEYTAKAFRRACERLGVCQSMGRPGSALDNAVIESWHSTLEFELRRVQHFATNAAARAKVAAWIEDYNTTRDVVWREDQSTIRTGNAPQVMSALTNLVITLFRIQGVTKITEETRRNAQNPRRPLQLLALWPG